MTPTLKCDAEGCGYSEEVAEVSEELIGKPCPKCGTNMLTREDYEDALEMAPHVSAFEKVMNAIGEWAKEQGYETKKSKVTVNPHGGRVNISVQDAEDST